MTVESVWDYPRPPALVPCDRRVRIMFAGATIADSDRALRILETSHPPTIYIPAGDISHVEPSRRRGTLCEWKGRAVYWDVVVGERRSEAAAWSYPDPVPAYAALRDHLCFYPSRVDECRLGDELVQAQEGDFYGGWITGGLRGPFKGAPGTLGW
jgi:uncharacterized protein (DUF427 family)